MKKPTKKTKPAQADNEELRRWCIENAIRWPTTGGYGGAIGGAHMPSVEVDVIGRAKRLLAWVTEPQGQ